MIRGVKIKELVTHCDDRGYFREILRDDDNLLKKFGQTSVTETYPGVIKAFHWHKKQDDLWFVATGKAKIVLFDDRTKSSTYGKTQVIMAGENDYKVILIPAGILHGYQVMSKKPVLLFYHTTENYHTNNPDEERVAYNDPKIGFNMINARVETIECKVSFKNPFKYRRCVIPASGFYEWKSEKKQKLPYYFQAENKKPLLFAALWEFWHGEGGEELRTCSIITTKANKHVGFLHDRMPLMLDIETSRNWMSPEYKPNLKNIVANSFSKSLVNYPVSKEVNNPRVDTSECIAEVNDKHPVQLTFF